MKAESYLTGLVLVLLTTVGIGQEDLQKKYIGQSKCIPELQSATGSYGIRLDKSQKAYLAAYKLGQRDVLTIVQYRDDNDRCGVIRDVIQSRHATAPSYGSARSGGLRRMWLLVHGPQSTRRYLG